MKLPGARAFQPVVMAVVAVIIAPFFTAINIVTWQAVGASSPDDVVLMTLVGDSSGSLSGSLGGLM